ncbi:MAG: sulfatase-like hydrolase/transferase [Saprospiraceae bacterium]|nr:sulfatase-like hydrolase/transferase [Saprospiraceae bacterium]
MKKGNIISSIAVATLLLFTQFRQTSAEVDERPNIILIMVDDLGYETVQANGGTSYLTPNLDQMAEEGMRFEHCYAQPLCTPSRVQIMTGIYNVRNYIKFGLLDTSQTTFGHLFQEAGYQTCIVGKWQLGKDPMSPRWAGFQEHCLWQVRTGRVDSTGRDTRFSEPILETNGTLKTYGKEEFGPRVVADYGMDFIERAAKKGDPFLLYYPMILTHCPFSPTPDSPEWAVDDTTVMKYKGQAHYFEDMVAYTDRIIGEINAKLEELGIAENTLVIFTGDNGTDVPVVSEMRGQQVAGAKGESTDAGTRVPLLVKWPTQIQGAQENRDLVDFTDMLPTICEASGIAIPDSLDLDGQSFLPLLKGEETTTRSWIYSWYSRSGELEKARVFARNQQYKLYDSGEFYEVPADYLEENPIPLDSLNAEQQEIATELKAVLDHYAARRLADIE